MLKKTHYCALQDIINHFENKNIKDNTMTRKLKAASFFEGFITLESLKSQDFKDHKAKHKEAYEIMDTYLKDNNVKSVFIVPIYLLQSE